MTKANVPITSEDLFVRRVYIYGGVSIIVDIDLLKKTISLMDKEGDQFKRKKWLFTDRTEEYLQGWINIMAAMQQATYEAGLVLKEASDRDTEKFAKLLMALDKPEVKKKKNA